MRLKNYLKNQGLNTKYISKTSRLYIYVHSRDGMKNVIRILNDSEEPIYSVKEIRIVLKR